MLKQSEHEEHSLNLKDLCIIGAVALAVRSVFFLFSSQQVGAEGFWSLSPDTRAYLAIARDFMEGTSNAEPYLFAFGPGFGLFLALMLTIFGTSADYIITIQLLLSAASCVLVYMVVIRLSLPRCTAIIAAVLLALSSTSISLSCMILSDTLFVFLFLAGLLLFLRGLQTGSWWSFVSCGFVVGAAILVRSIGQLWPLGMLILAIPLVFTRPGRRWQLNRRLAILAAACLVLIGAIEAAWIYRNSVVHQIPVLTSASSGGMANVAAYAMEGLEGRPYREIRADWHRTYLTENNLHKGTVEATHAADVRAADRVIEQHPWEVVRAYLSLAWENAIAVNHLNRLLLPNNKSDVVWFEYELKDVYNHYYGLLAAVLGLTALVFRRKYLAALVLGLIFFYFLSMIGFTRWQGSRLFFPSQIATTILGAVCLWQAGLWISGLMRRLRDHFGREYADGET